MNNLIPNLTVNLRIILSKNLTVNLAFSIEKITIRLYINYKATLVIYEVAEFVI